MEVVALDVAVLLLAIVAAISAAGLVAARRTALTKPSVRQQVKALGTQTAEWAIPYKELKFSKLLGKGSQGEVFLADWRSTAVAVKKVDTSQVDPAIIEEFCQEAGIMRRLRHPNVTLFMGVSVSYPHVCIVTEMVEKGNLFDLLHDMTQPLPWTRALRLALDVAMGVQYLHEYNPPIIHRDLKSLNILVDANWRGKVADFGMTRFHNEGTMTQCGSPLWMSPEMIQNVAYDHRADVYSFGIVLWELYTRRIPYRGTGIRPAKLVVKVVKEGLRPVIPPRCPAAYASLMEQCWSADPAKRPNFAKIVRTLQGFLKDPVMVAHQPQLKEGGPVEPEPEPSKQQDDAAAGSAAAAAGAAPDLPPTWEVDYERDITLGPVIGRGSKRGTRVHEATFRGSAVAVKVFETGGMPAEAREEQERQVRLEAQTLGRLRHPNLNLFMGYFVAPAFSGIVMERAERGSLRDLMRDQSVALHWGTIMSFLLDAAQGIAFLHNQKPPVVHGCLTTSRLLVTQGWRVKISGHVGGVLEAPTPYTAPEILLAASSAPSSADARGKGGTKPAAAPTAKSDVYSFALLMWALLTRSEPHTAATGAAAERTYLSPELIPHIIGGRRPAIPQHVHNELRSLLEQCWDPNPSKRPDIARVVQQLASVRDAGPPRVKVTASNAQRYHKARTVTAYRSKDPVTVEKDWGKSRGKPGCYVVSGAEDDVYVSEPAVFEESYELVPGRQHEYRKVGEVLARQMDCPFAVRTASGDVVGGGPGDFVVQNDSGEQWVVPDGTFRELYARVATTPALVNRTMSGTVDRSVAPRGTGPDGGRTGTAAQGVAAGRTRRRSSNRRELLPPRSPTMPSRPGPVVEEH